MNNETNSKELGKVLNREKKRRRTIYIIGVLICLIFVIGMAIVIVNKMNKDDKSKKIEGITVDGEQMKFSINRELEMYDKDPTIEYVNEPEAKILRKVNVMIEGNADFETEKFDGEMNIDGYELDGNLVGYASGKADFDTKWIYSLCAINTSDDENQKLTTLQYDVMISEDRTEMLIFIWPVDSGKEVTILYEKVNGN